MHNNLKRMVVASLVFLMAACGGSGGDGGSRDNAAESPAALSCGGGAETACPGGYRCVDDSSDNCDAMTGVDCDGICILGEALPSCGGLNGVPCAEGSVCVDDPNDACDGGPAVDCPGVCEARMDGECSSDSDCVAIAASCAVCADGTFSCPAPICDGGKCTVIYRPCPPEETCGGFGGLPCPRGFECIDPPGDGCDPANGGADCPGVCVPHHTEGCSGVAGIACPDGFNCVDDPADMCDPNHGADCPGVCEPASVPECATNQDCPQVRGPCAVCADGSEKCPSSTCRGGTCHVEFPSCQAPEGCGADGEVCKPGYVCVFNSDGMCDPSTGVACRGVCTLPEGPRPCGGFAGDTCPPGFECVDLQDECSPDAGGADCPAVCEPVSPGECKVDEDCGAILAPCRMCPDGSVACPKTYCANGACQIAIDMCSGPDFCGGIAGFPCAPGYTCVDQPNDDCDPATGGADCGGMCVREDQPRACGGFAGETCPPAYECADDSRDDCDPNHGGADCPGVCRPAPTQECRSDADCVVIGAPCLICADGTAACPDVACVNGACTAKFERCESMS